MNYWNRVQIWLITWLLKHHTYHDTISSAGPEGRGGGYDTYWIQIVRYEVPDEGVAEFEAVELGDHESAPRVAQRLNLSLDDHGQLTAQELKRESRDPDKPIHHVTPEFLSQFFIEIRHFYRDEEFDKHSLVIVFLRRFLGLNPLCYWLLKLNIWYQSRRFTVVDDYVSVLQAVLRASELSYSPTGYSKFDIADALYGKKLKTTNLNIQFRSAQQVEQVLNYLAAVGHIDLDGDGRYRPNVYTLNAIRERERERAASAREARHARYQFLLTFILAVSSTAMAAVEFARQGWWPFN